MNTDTDRRIIVRAMLAALALLGIVCAVMLVAPHADARDRAASTTDIVVVPGTAQIYHSGDPIKICTRTNTPNSIPVTLTLEQKDMSLANPTWQPLWNGGGYSNAMTCGIGVVKGTSDMQLRARTLNSPTVAASTSRTVTVTVVR